MKLTLRLELGWLTLTIGPPAEPAAAPPGFEASVNGSQAELSDQLPLGFGPALATEREHRY